MMAVLLAGGLGTLRAQIPADDARNTYVPNTDTHLTMPVYRTLAEWEARKAHLRKQILAAAGLLPMRRSSMQRPTATPSSSMRAAHCALRRICANLPLIPGS